jgi:hypothetical protein
LADLILFRMKGRHLTPTQRRGRFLFFSVDIETEEAERLLRSPERQFIGRCLEELRHLRRVIDVERDRELAR